MFDGNHRVRREVNLSGSRRRGRDAASSSSSGRQQGGLLRNSVSANAGIRDRKSELLESARIQREQRRELQRRHDSAKNIARIWRGWIARITVARELERQTTLLASLITPIEASSLDRWASLLAMRLSPNLLPVIKAGKNLTPSRDHILLAVLDFESKYSQFNQAFQLLGDGSRGAFISGRIVRASLRLLTGLCPPPTFLSSEPVDATDSAVRLVTLLSCLLNTGDIIRVLDGNTLVSRNDNEAGLLLLLLCFKNWFWTAVRSYTSKSKTTEIAKKLLHMSCKAAAALSSSTGNAGRKGGAVSILAASVFCSNTSFFSGVSKTGKEEYWTKEIQACYQYFQANGTGVKSDTNSKETWYVDLLHALVLVMHQSRDEEICGPDGVVHQIVLDMIQGREYMLLSNALSLYWSATASPSSQSMVEVIVGLLHHTFLQKPEFAMLTSLAASGENINDLILNEIKTSAPNENNLMDGLGEQMDEDEGDSSDEVMEEDEDRASAPLISSTTKRHVKRSKYSRLTRSQIQTLPKLDQIYQSEIQKLRKSTVAMIQPLDQEIKALITDLAMQIGGKAKNGHWLMLELGLSILHGDRAFISNQSCLAYLGVLSEVMQSSARLRARARAMSPLLSALAFNDNFLEGLWLCIGELSSSVKPNEFSLTLTSVVSTTAVFCDCFSHRLLATDDDEFLTQYTNTSGSNAKTRISAETLVLKLRLALHELYWSRPVVASDIGAPSCLDMSESDSDLALCRQRARLLISGTKLFNALYERWSRLFRYASFCDESSWWFPRLVSRERDDDGAIVPGRGQEPLNEGTDEMEDTSVGSPMDIDDSSSEEGEMNNDGGMGIADEENEALADSFKDPKMARVLTSVPQALPFDRRVNLFQSLLNTDKLKTQDETLAFRAMVEQMQRPNDIDQGEYTGREKVEIRRDVLYGDSMDQLNKLGPKLRRRVQVTFVNQHGAFEAGIDGGGVFKEFLDDLIKEAFDPKNAEDKSKNAPPPLFVVSPIEALYVNTGAESTHGRNNNILTHYEFLGRVLGKAVYESILVEPQFCLPFLNQLLGKQNTLDDLKNLDPEYYKHLSSLKKMDDKEFKNLGLTFEMTTTNRGGSKTVEIIPGGSSMHVTKENVIRYVHLLSHRRLNVEAAMQTRAFLRGFRDLIPAPWVRLFSSYELQKLISGDDSVKGIDVANLKGVIQYNGGYHPTQPVIQWLWEIMDEFTPDQQRKFLKFMTSCSRQPLLGFGALVPLPCIQKIRLRDDEIGAAVKLPTSSTCMNLLKLPDYKTKQTLKDKLLYAIEAGAGFELT
eukprot:CAMPEP_0198293348 /NCGR_PEP_ID=MMETSP1449-20131203/16620_1 /TAXON_ID=420275 /ORGANISM="Attheya septentrionalis, Strain CCMP2084" /LENGTH=1294 /DNA_ID=CAMNT_0043992895 /DNA_START=157 /DNA_END=4041 /DNA_ORIENTATION=-